MNSTQLLKAAVKLDHSRSYMAGVDHWKPSYTAECRPAEFKLAVLPGIDGTDCQHIHGKSFAECLAEFKASIKHANAK